MASPQFVIHILAVSGTPIPHPLALEPGQNCVLGHRIIEDPEKYPVPEGMPVPPWPLLANGQQFVAGLEVDASFTQGGGLFLEVAHVRCRYGVTAVWFRWPTTRPYHYVASLLDQFGYQVVEDPKSIIGQLPSFFPGLRV